MTPNPVRAFRRRWGLTQRHLAEALGCHRQTISDWERGKLPLSRQSQLALIGLEVVARSDRTVGDADA